MAMRFTVQDHLTEKIFFALSNAFAFLCVCARALVLFSALGQFIPVILSSFPRSDCDRGKRHRSALHNIVVRHTRDHHRANGAQSMWHLVTISPLMTRVTVLSGTAIASPPSARREMHALPCALSWKLCNSKRYISRQKKKYRDFQSSCQIEEVSFSMKKRIQGLHL